MYNSAWRGFEAWAQGRGALAMPASPPIAAAYLAHLAEERRMSVATIRLHRAALAAIHKTAGHPDPTDNEPVKQIMKGIARAHGRAQKQAKPLTAEGPGRSKSYRRHQAILRRPGKGPGVGGESFVGSPGGPGPAGHPTGWVAVPVRGRGADLGRRGVP